jgi:carbonic anhydrase
MKDRIEEAVDALVEKDDKEPRRALTVHDTWEERREAEAFKHALSVRELVAQLLTYPQDLKVGATGHFGEFYGIDKYSISKYTKHGTDVSWVSFSCPDIGEPPD